MEELKLKSFNKNNFAQEFFLHINGQRVTIEAPEKISPETSLNTYLRNTLNLRDTKVMCREGGCGACVVSATFYDLIANKKKTVAVNSCLIPILACHNWEIVTNHGIGNKTKGYHEIQHALAKFGGSQCGFCSGGMVMNMFALSQSKDILSMKEIENSFGGNVCRCTGYRAILDAFKSLASDADRKMGERIPDIEDIKICPKSKKECSGICKDVNLDPICWKANGDTYWYKVYTIVDILKIFQIIGNDTYILVAGNTGRGLYPITTPQKYWIDIRDVKELTAFSGTENLVLGGGISITDCMTIMKKISDENKNFWYLDEVQKHLDLVANVPVRNSGTLAGNLTMKRNHHEFLSDIFVLLTAIGATITLVQSNGTEITKTVPEYVNMQLSKFVLKQITLPPKNENDYLFKSYKIMPRAQNAIAHINAGIMMGFEKDDLVKSCNIIFGGIKPNFVNAENTEKYLVGKKLFDNETIQGALKTLTEELQPDDVPSYASSEFRKNLARNLFYKFVLATAPRAKLNLKYLTGGLRLERGISKGVQLYQTNKEIYPVSKPVPKIEAMHQTSGEAQFIDDMPSMPGEVFAAFVLAETAPFSKIKEVDTSDALKIPGVISYVDHKDIPGKNLFCSPPLLKIEEELFCSGKVLYNGQPVGLILANSFDQAQAAANKVNITYEKQNETPIFKIKDVLKINGKERIKNIITKDGATKNIAKSKYKIKGEANFTGQYHFTMETQNCVSIPNDDGSYTLYPGTQWIDLNQYSAAVALNIPMNKINVVVKRVGGAFGGKQIRSAMISTACVVASHKVQRPVRLVLPLKTNMKAIGKRAPAFAKYEVETDENGKILHLDMSYYQAPGTSGPNEQIIIFINSFFKNGYDDETWKLSGNSVRTEMAGNCFMRAPANVEAIAIIENIMRHIAKVSGKNELQVREANFAPKGSEASDILKDTLSWAEYDKRRKEVDAFNKNNRWMKKGLGMAMMNFNMAILCPYSVMLSIFSADGSVTISHGGIECGQGINTKVIQVCAYQLQIPMNMITIQPTYNFISPNNQMTGAGVTSEAVCYATIQACEEMHRRLKPVKDKMNNPSWKELVRQAYVEEVELCTTYMFTSKSEPPYLIPGACLAEVQVDILTGEYLLNRVDLMEDLGVSLNPQVDVGQVEGAFVIGLGHFVSEELIYGDQGQLYTNDTWTYKVPGPKDIPVDFRVKFKVDGANPSGVLNTKACGEPAVCLAVSVPFAIRDALNSARKDAIPSDDTFIEIDGPTTVEFTLQNTLNDYKNYTL